MQGQGSTHKNSRCSARSLSSFAYSRPIALTMRVTPFIVLVLAVQKSSRRACTTRSSDLSQAQSAGCTPCSCGAPHTGTTPVAQYRRQTSTMCTLPRFRAGANARLRVPPSPEYLGAQKLHRRTPRATNAASHATNYQCPLDREVLYTHDQEGGGAACEENGSRLARSIGTEQRAA